MYCIYVLYTLSVRSQLQTKFMQKFIFFIIILLVFKYMYCMCIHFIYFFFTNHWLICAVVYHVISTGGQTRNREEMYSSGKHHLHVQYDLYIQTV